MARIFAIFLLGLASCTDTSSSAPSVLEAELGQTEVSEADTHAAELEGVDEPESTAEELAFAATEACRSFLSRDHNRTSANVVSVMENAAYISDSAKMRGELSSSFAEAEFFRKNAHGSHFLVFWSIGMSQCVVMLTEDSSVPEFEDIRDAFEERGWVRSGLVGTSGRPGLNGFRFPESGGDIFAVLREEPSNDPTVRLAIDVSFIGN